jgi:hypothetical protein
MTTVKPSLDSARASVGKQASAAAPSQKADNFNLDLDGPIDAGDFFDGVEIP